MLQYHFAHFQPVITSPLSHSIKITAPTTKPINEICPLGQICLCPDYVLVPDSIKPALIAEMKKVLNQFHGSDPAQSADYDGKIVNQRHTARLMYAFFKNLTKKRVKKLNF